MTGGGADTALVAAVRETLREAADPDRAGPMQSYMKSALPYYGVAMPNVRKRVREVCNERRILDRAVWDRTVRALYDEATHREERYAALTLLAHRYYREWNDPGTFGLYEHLIRTGAWWDLVDETSHRVGDVLRRHRATVTPVVESWSTSDSLWLRRSAIICQVGHKADTDLDLLGTVIGPNIPDRDFFIRKAIGWGLREAAYVAPDWVRSYVATHPDLSPLSVREATKHLSP